jgi:hypothetical protein
MDILDNLENSIEFEDFDLELANQNPHKLVMTHDCIFNLDLDGQVTCTLCGAMDDDMLAGTKEMDKTEQ